MMGAVGLRRGRIFVYQGACDMRRSFDRLSSMVKEELKEDPLSGDMFVFLNRGRRTVKCLVWDKDGYVIWYKRLERGRFSRPRGEGKEVSAVEWMHILEGMEVNIVKYEPRYIVDGEK